MNSINYNNQIIKIRGNRFSLDDVCKILDKEPNHNDVYCTKDELIEEFDKEKELIDFLKNLDISVNKHLKKPLLNITDYINKNNINLSVNDIFLNLWYSFQNQKEILITDDLLELMGFDFKLKSYIEFLNENGIEFEQIDCKHRKALNYEIIQKYIHNSATDQRWTILTIDNFKDSIMILNNNKANQFRKYYNKLEKVFYSYEDYVKEYKFQQELKEIEESKNKEINEKQKELEAQKLELEKAKKKNLRINKFLNNITIKTKKIEWIYIASTDLYQQENIYKIGSTERLLKRIAGYQTGRILSDNFYYVQIFKCYNSKDLDSFIQHILKDFIYQKNKEMYNGIHITDLIDIVEFLVSNYDKAVDYIYSFVKTKLENSMSKEPLILKRIYLKNIPEITNKVSKEKTKIDIEKEKKKLIREAFFNFLETLENNSELYKKDLISDLNLNTNITETWNEIKSISNWINSKTPIEYNDKKFFIKYR